MKPLKPSKPSKIHMQIRIKSVFAMVIRDGLSGFAVSKIY